MDLEAGSVQQLVDDGTYNKLDHSLTHNQKCTPSLSSTSSSSSGNSVSPLLQHQASQSSQSTTDDDAFILEESVSGNTLRAVHQPLPPLPPLPEVQEQGCLVGGSVPMPPVDMRVVTAHPHSEYSQLVSTTRDPPSHYESLH